MDDSELLNVADDEFDAFNDETFGDDGGEYKWEPNQAMFEDFLGSEFSNGSKKEQAVPDIGSDEDIESRAVAAKAQEDFLLYKAQSKEAEYDEFVIENALEESISRLVLDEFDDDDEAVSKEKLRRINANNIYFMPPQVVNRNLQWFMDKELPGGNSLLGSSVWSMHPTSISTNKNDSYESPAASAVCSTPKNYTETVDKFEVDFPSTSGVSSTPDLGNLLGLSSLSSASAAQASPVALSKPPTFKTVDEIEQELLRESEAPKAPPKPTAMEEIKSRPKVMSLEELERQLIQESPGVQSSQDAPQQVMSQGGRSAQPPQTPPVQGDMMRPPFRGPAMVPPVLTPAAAAALNAKLFLAARHPMPGRPHPMPFPQQQSNFPPNIMNRAGVAAQAVIQQQIVRQQLMRQMQMQSAPGQYFPVPGAQGVPHMGKMPYRFPGAQPQPNNLSSHAYRRHDTKTDLGDAGLMTEKDKQRLKNIQIVQLQNDHPHTTDYYCLMRKVRRGGNGQQPLDILKLLFPRKNDEDDSNRRHYEPAHFENSLGKLQAQSALAPKKAIDTVIRVIDTGPQAGKKKSYRYLLLEIEKMYECLLALEETDLRVVLETNLGPEEQDIRVVKEKVLGFLQDASKLSEVMTVKKGKVLVCRLAALIDQTGVRNSAIRHVFRTFPSWAASTGMAAGSSDLVELFPYIRHCVLSMDAENFEPLCGDLDDASLSVMVTMKLGVSMIMVVLHQGEKLCRKDPSDQFKAVWVKTVYKILTALLRDKQLVIPPVELYLLGLQRLLTNDLHRLNQQVSEEFTVLLTAYLNAGTKQIKQDY